MTTPETNPEAITQYLQRLDAGDSEALELLYKEVYGDLRLLADQIFRGQPSQHTLQPTALVNEAYLRLVGGQGKITDRRHFLNVAAMAMRQLLTDHARAKSAAKRGGGHRVALEVDTPDPGQDDGLDLVELDAALTKLKSIDERQARIVELRFLAGLTYGEIGEVVGISERTARLDWSMARAWLKDELGRG